MFRHQPPAYSPLSGSALSAGLAAMLGDSEVWRWRTGAEIKRRFSPRKLLLTDSGTSAVCLALKGAVGMASGDVAVLPGFSCYDIATAAEGADVGVRLYDLEPATLSPKPDSLRTAVTEETAAVLGVHLYGVPLDPGVFEEVRGDPQSAGPIFIEDAAQAWGLRYPTQPAGSLGDLAVLSFGRGKGVTGGGGGALLAQTPRGEEALELIEPRLTPTGLGLRRAAETAGQMAFSRPSLYGIPASLPFLHLGETTYREPCPPSGMPDFCAGVLSVSMELADAEVPARRANAKHLRKVVRSLRGIEPVAAPPGRTPSYLRFPVRVAAGLRSRFRTGEARRLGVMPAYPKPLRRLKGFRDRCRRTRTSLPGAKELSDGLFTLPTHSRLGEKDRHRLGRWLEKTVGP